MSICPTPKTNYGGNRYLHQVLYYELDFHLNNAGSVAAISPALACRRHRLPFHHHSDWTLSYAHLFSDSLLKI